MKKKTLLFLVVLALSLVGCSNTTSSTTSSADSSSTTSSSNTSTDSSSTTSSSDTSSIDSERTTGILNEEVKDAAIQMYIDVLKSTFEIVPTIRKPLYVFGAYGRESDVYVLMADIEMFREYEEQELIKWHGTYTFRAEISDPNTTTNSYKEFVFKKMPETVTILHDNKVYDLEEAYSENLLSIGEIEDIYSQFVELFGMPNESDFEEVNIGIKNAEVEALAIQMGCYILNFPPWWVKPQENLPATEEDVQLNHFFGAYGENNDIYVVSSSNPSLTDWFFSLGLESDDLIPIKPLSQYMFYHASFNRELPETTSKKYSAKIYDFYPLPYMIMVFKDNEMCSLSMAFNNGYLGPKEIEDIYWQYVYYLLPKNS